MSCARGGSPPRTRIPQPRSRMPATLREFPESDHDAGVALCHSCALTVKPSDSLPELRKFVAGIPGLFSVSAEGCAAAGEEGEVAGTVMRAWAGRRSWVSQLAVRPESQRRGTARLLMDEVERRLRAVGATKLNLLVERGNESVSDFYGKLGYAPDDLL